MTPEVGDLVTCCYGRCGTHRAKGTASIRADDNDVPVVVDLPCCAKCGTTHIRPAPPARRGEAR